jgi:UDP-N-acetylglucosamine 2-epimerase (non-hydrolysing)
MNSSFKRNLSIGIFRASHFPKPSLTNRRLVFTLREVRLWFVLGTAAELIKVFPVIKEAGERGIPWLTVSTGQSAVGFMRQWEDFDLPQTHLLSALATHADLARSSAALKWFLRAWYASPYKWFEHGRQVLGEGTGGKDYIVVHGDTLSTLVGSKWASRLGIDIVHVEAGLRSSRLFSPFPEEINRRLVSRKVRFHMVPDSWAANNLKKAGYDDGIIDTGSNTLVDAVRMFAAARPQGESKNYVMVNIHRFENLNSGKRWQFIVDTLKKAAAKWELRAVMHPQTAAKIAAHPGLRADLEGFGVKFMERMPFSQFIRQLANAEFVISDGGSNQEECFYLGKPCLLLRNETERREGLGGPCILSKFESTIVDDFLKDPGRFARPPAWPENSPSRLILDVLKTADHSAQ